MNDETEVSNPTPDERPSGPMDQEPSPEPPAGDGVVAAGQRVWITEAEREGIERRFTYHAPKGDQAERYVAIRGEAHDLALLLMNLCPRSRELSLALTHLEQTAMWANAAIARNE